MDNVLNSKFLTYLFAFLGFAAIVANALGYISIEIMLVVLGLGTFGSVAAFRDWVNSQGWKTYAIVGVGILGVAAVGFGFIAIEQFILIYTLLFGGSVATVVHALKKAPAGEKLKPMSVKKAA